MVILIFGESCTGKSSLADYLKEHESAQVFSGKDYLRLKKNPEEAKAYFKEYLRENQEDEKILIYVIAELEQFEFIPDQATRVYCYANLGTIQQRFAKRMHGILPPPVATMLEQKHGMFEDEQYDLKFDTSVEEIASMCEEILNYSK